MLYIGIFFIRTEKWARVNIDTNAYSKKKKKKKEKQYPILAAPAQQSKELQSSCFHCEVFGTNRWTMGIAVFIYTIVQEK